MKNKIAELIKKQDELESTLGRYEELCSENFDNLCETILTPSIKKATDKYYKIISERGVNSYKLPKIGNRYAFTISENFITVQTCDEYDEGFSRNDCIIKIPFYLYDCEESIIDEYFKKYYESVYEEIVSFEAYELENEKPPF